MCDKRGYRSTLAQEAGENMPDILTDAEVYNLIDDLQQRPGRGRA